MFASNYDFAYPFLSVVNVFMHFNCFDLGNLRMFVCSLNNLTTSYTRNSFT